VLPPVIGKGDFHPFKFWFNNQLQDGMLYRNELFYRLQTVSTTHRARLYRYACKIAQQHTVVVTALPNEYSMWVSLRSPSLFYQAQEKLLKKLQKKSKTS
jgi:hypothetical protein